MSATPPTTTKINPRPFPRLAADDPFADPSYVAPIDDDGDDDDEAPPAPEHADAPAASPPSNATGRTRGRRRERPATGNRAKPTNAPRFNGPAGINAFRATCRELAGDPRMSAAAAHVWRVIWTYADDHGRASVSITTVAADAVIDRRTVTRATSKLADLGLLTTLKRGASATHRPNLYRLSATVPEG